MNNITITDVRAHPGDSAFLIDDGKTAILLDSGYGFTGYVVADRIRMQLGSRPLDYIFLTHSHYDHAMGSAYVLKHWPDARVVAGEYAAYIFQRPSAKKVMRELDRKIAAACGVLEYEDRADLLRVDIPVRDGDLVQAGDLAFTVINLPGHTKCSVGFYLADRKLLISTETLGVLVGDGDVFPSYLVGYQMTLDSIARVEALDIKQILLPHYGLLDREQTRVYLKKAKKNAIETAEGIAQILKAGGSKAEAADYVKRRFYQGSVRTFYPTDARELNTRIMVDLIEKELVLK